MNGQGAKAKPQIAPKSKVLSDRRIVYLGSELAFCPGTELWCPMDILIV